MVVVKFQGLDIYNSIGLYSLCAKIFGSHNVCRDYSSTNNEDGNDTVILFRSKLASFSECTCHLSNQNVITITVLEKGWDSVSSKNKITISLSDSIDKIEAVIRESAKPLNEKSSIRKCIYCQTIRMLPKEDLKVISMLSKGLQSNAIASVLGTNNKRVSYHKNRIMRRIGIHNSIEFHRFILTLTH